MLDSAHHNRGEPARRKATLSRIDQYRDHEGAAKAVGRVLPAFVAWRGGFVAWRGGWNPPHLCWVAHGFSRGGHEELKGDVRVNHDTIMVTYYNAPAELRVPGT